MLITLVLAVGVSIVVSAACSLLESILYSTRYITLEAAAAAGSHKAKAMGRLKAEVDRPLAAILILNTLANTAGAALAGWAAGRLWGPGALWVFSLGFTLAILVFSEILPKTVGAVYWRRLWPWAVGPLKLMVGALAPAIWLTRALTSLITGHRSAPAVVSEEEILAAARLGEKGGQISAIEAEIIRNIIGLEQLHATDIMTPRTVMFTVEASRPLSELQAEARTWVYTRVPVYEREPENIIGYINKHELLRISPSPSQQARSIAKPITFVPGTANALGLLRLFLSTREHMAIVVDEYGGVLGLVTLEDVLESLVGREIVDEKDVVVDLQELARLKAKAVLRQGEE